MLENEEAAQRLFGNRFCFPQAFVVASLSASICVKSSFSFLADLRWCSLLPSAYLQSAPICVKSSLSFLADFRWFSLRPSAYLQSASICVKQSFLFSQIFADFLWVHLCEIFSFFSQIYGDFLCVHLRIFNLCPSAWNLLFLSRRFTRILSASSALINLFVPCFPFSHWMIFYPFQNKRIIE